MTEKYSYRGVFGGPAKQAEQRPLLDMDAVIAILAPTAAGKDYIVSAPAK